MKTLDNMLLHELLRELDTLIEERKVVKQYRNAPIGYTLEEYLQELDEEELILRGKIEELSIVEEDYSEEL